MKKKYEEPKVEDVELADETMGTINSAINGQLFEDIFDLGE